MGSSRDEKSARRIHQGHYFSENWTSCTLSTFRLGQLPGWKSARRIHQGHYFFENWTSCIYFTSDFHEFVMVSLWFFRIWGRQTNTDRKKNKQRKKHKLLISAIGNVACFFFGPMQWLEPLRAAKRYKWKDNKQRKQTSDVACFFFWSDAMAGAIACGQTI